MMLRISTVALISLAACSLPDEHYSNGSDAGAMAGGSAVNDAGGAAQNSDANAVGTSRSCTLKPLAVQSSQSGQPRLKVGGTAPYAVAVGALNPATTSAGAGWNDIVVADAANEVFILTNQRNTAPLTFESAKYPTDAATATETGSGVGASIAIGDVNADHLNDIVVGNYGTRDVGVMLNGKMGLSPVQPFPTGAGNPASVSLAHVKHTSRLDIVVADMNASGKVSVLPNGGSTASTMYGAATMYETVSDGSTKSVATGDLVGPGSVDIVAANKQAGSVSVLINNGSGALLVGTAYLTDAPDKTPWPIAVALADRAGDGFADIVVANSGTQSVGVLFNNHAVSPSFQLAIFPVSSAPLAVAVADVTGDRQLDIVVAGPAAESTGTGSVTVLAGASADTAGRDAFSPVSTIASDDPQSIAIGDVNGDGKPDIIVVSSAGEVSVFSCTSQ